MLSNDLERIKYFARLANTFDETLLNIRNHIANNPDALRELAYALYESDRFEQTLSVAMQGLAIAPTHPVLRYDAARACSITGDVEQSRQHIEIAVSVHSKNPYFQSHYADTLLRLGKFEEGWKRKKWYYQLPRIEESMVQLPFPRWSGEPVAGSRFLLVGEQGRGDEIQFLRFAEWLNEKGAIVDALVSEPIAPLAKSMASIRATYTRIPPCSYQYWCHITRVPEFMNLELSMLPYATRYISSSPEKDDFWNHRINALTASKASRHNMKIGVVWEGGPAHSLDRFRSISLNTFTPLFTLPNVTWFSLQKGKSEQASRALEENFDIHTLGPEIHDFTDTLSILNQLDLLISVDTSVAHLAGAGGTPVWTLIPAYGDWRWLTHRTDSPWYPTMRLFRQRKLGNWIEVVSEVRGALLARTPLPPPIPGIRARSRRPALR
ncbi:hypothetical protein [Paraburkholderia sacchari]|uniref:hypothetical protein n=1 Tax=Paraburkholderia sacchari TaxID=159450 RepID=UPI001BCD1AC9|nr:hypothetical protein [Paraburkholderia sacchari]